MAEPAFNCGELLESFANSLMHSGYLTPELKAKLMQERVIYLPVPDNDRMLFEVRIDSRDRLHVCTVPVKVKPEAADKCRIRAFLNRSRADTTRPAGYKFPK